MAAREHEEEQTQRTMLALNTLQSSYPGKEQNDVTKIIKDVRLIDYDELLFSLHVIRYDLIGQIRDQK